MANITSSTYPVVEDSGNDLYAIVRNGQLKKQTKAALLDVATKEAVAELRQGGTTRPSNPEPYQAFFDANLGKPVWWSGLSWVDATGAAV